MSENMDNIELFNPYKKFNGVFIPEWLLEYDKVSLPAKLLYAVLSKFAGENGYCYPGQETLSKRIGASKRSVRNYLNELLDSELIIQRRVGMGRTNRYYFVWQPELMNPSVSVDEPIENDDRPEKFADQERQGLSDQERQGLATPYNKELNESDCNMSQEVYVETSGPDDYPDVCEYLDEARELADYLLAAITRWKPDHRFASNPPDTGGKNWTLEIERAIRLDGRDPHSIRHVIDYTFTQPTRQARFWAKNVNSGGKLRDQYDRMVEDYRDEIRKNRNSKPNLNHEQLDDHIERAFAAAGV